jgi:uncharacterized protein YukE
MTDDWPGPAGYALPGDPAVLRLTAARLRETASAAREVREELDSIGAGDGANWIGVAGDAFRDRVKNHRSDYDKLARSYDLAAEALLGFALRHDDLQVEVNAAVTRARDAAAAAKLADGRRDRLLASARSLRTEGTTVRAQVSAAQVSDAAIMAAGGGSWEADQLANRAHALDGEAAGFDHDAAAATAEATAARRAVAVEHERVDELHMALVDAGKTLADKLDEARHEGLRNKSVLQQIGSGVHDFFAANIGVLRTMSKALGWIILAIAIIAVVVSIVATGGAALVLYLNAAAVILSVTKLGIDCARKAGGDEKVSYQGLLLDAAFIVVPAAIKGARLTRASQAVGGVRFVKPGWRVVNSAKAKVITTAFPKLRGAARSVGQELKESAKVVFSKDNAQLAGRGAVAVARNANAAGGVAQALRSGGPKAVWQILATDGTPVVGAAARRAAKKALRSFARSVVTKTEHGTAIGVKKFGSLALPNQIVTVVLSPGVEKVSEIVGEVKDIFEPFQGGILKGIPIVKELFP